MLCHAFIGSGSLVSTVNVEVQAFLTARHTPCRLARVWEFCPWDEPAVV